MNCPRCATEDTRVVDSRPSDGGATIRRRRECTTCGHRFTTYERYALSITVRKRNGSIEDFDPAKIRQGVESALADRPVPPDTIAKILANLPELQDRVGELIADLLGVEAALVTTGAAGGIVLGTAAALTYQDHGLVGRLPLQADESVEVRGLFQRHARGSEWCLLRSSQLGGPQPDLMLQ